MFKVKDNIVVGSFVLSGGDILVTGKGHYLTMNTGWGTYMFLSIPCGSVVMNKNTKEAIQYKSHKSYEDGELIFEDRISGAEEVRGVIRKSDVDLTIEYIKGCS